MNTMRENTECLGEKTYKPTTAQNKSSSNSTESSLIGAAWGSAKPAVHKAFKMMDAGVDWLCGSVPEGKSPKPGQYQSQDSDFSASLVMSCSAAPGEMVGTPAAGSENPFF